MSASHANGCRARLRKFEFKTPPGLSETVKLSKDDGYDEKQNGKLLLARFPRACGSEGLRASKLLGNAGGRDCGDCTEDRMGVVAEVSWRRIHAPTLVG